MGWKLHVLKTSILGRVPFGDQLRRIKRQTFGYLPDPDNLRGTLQNLDDMRNAVHAAGRSFADATVLEIGSGWFPTIPIMLSAQGARKVFLTDLNPHMDRTTFAATLDFLRPYLVDHPRAAGKSSLEDFGLEYIAPFRPDAIPNGTIDFIISRTVLEHIPAEDLQGILAELRPKLATGGLMLHCVDHSDHLEHRDKSISKINFLTWSERRHKLVNWLTKEGENRLRHHEYRKVFERAGYEIAFESGQPHPATLESARTLPLQHRFAQMTPAEVSILSSIYLLSPRPGAR
ncbi:MAG: class I SAM-dependent methyltransferase [Rubrivivax sp.]|nr:class I SAM-dependent methyltransferase [Rubrivivax sp.]